MKRTNDFSSSDSELDDNTEIEKEGSEDSRHLPLLSGSLLPSTTQVQARKRRRGVIEKRRRDRINNSLSELRRLVPCAFDKQGSAKLEKAEILQMTVDHLKMLHASGSKGYFDAHSLAMDYRSLGFRECLAETVRYLSIIEGLDHTDPLRLRLVSHLCSYASQREMHAGLSHFAWGSAFGASPAHLTHLLQHQQGQTSHSSCSSPSPSPSSSESPATPRVTGTALAETRSLRVSLHGSLPHSSPRAKISSPLLPGLPAIPLTLSTLPLLAPVNLVSDSSLHGARKPYRPWGTEIGAF